MNARILLVDDDDDFRYELIQCLEDFGTVGVASGEEALRILRRPNSIDLVVLDVMMPGIGGIETLNRIKKVSPEIRIIMLTGCGSKDVVVQALRAHADDFIEKPVDVERVRAVAERILGRANGTDDINCCGTRKKIEMVQDYAQRNIDKMVSLKDSASLVYLSQKYLSRVFKEKTGVGFGEYKLKLRMEKARTLLKESEMTVNQVSYKLGYKNTESFIRIFKKHAGCTPTEFRAGVPERKRRRPARLPS